MLQTCEAFEASGTLNRYVAGIATNDEACAFEEHYITCDHCFDALVLAAGVRAELRRPPAPAIPLQPRKRRNPRGFYTISIGIAAVLSGILVLRSVSSAHIRSLGALADAPAYGGVAVRASETRADAQFEAGMSAYAEGRYREAVDQLNAALRAGIEPLPTEFFLGASLLKLNDVPAAITWFNRVLAHGDSPYQAEAHYYLAKALLRHGKAAAALEHLNAVANDAPIAARARALADSIPR